MARISAGLLLLLLMAAPSMSAERFAFVIGQNRGGPAASDLRFAEDDAKRYAQLLEDFAEVPDSNIRLLLHPDSGALAQTAVRMTTMLRGRGDPSDALLFFYYSGHADAEGLLLDSTRFSFSALRLMLDSMPSGVRIAVFDACQSGVVVALKGGARAEPFFFADRMKIRGEIWIASASASERAQESATLKSSLFSFHFFTGLHGSADVSGDGRITAAEAYQYAYRKTLETSALTTGVLQHPVYRFNITGEGDVVLVDLSKRRGGIIVDTACTGTFLILSRNYTDVFADFYKENNREKFVALPPGDYTIINARDGSKIGLYRFSITGRKTIRCAAAGFQPSLLPYSGAAGQ